jgi:protoporphyrinogen oxidase
MKEFKKKIGIIGAGPAGLTAAYILSKNGIKVDVFESTESVGGMAKTIKLWDQLVDLGPHRFFSQDPRVNKILFEVLENDYTVVNRMTRIYYNNFFFDYPLKPFNALKGLGFIESIKCIISFFKSKLINLNYQNKKENTFEDWVKNRFGKRLFEIFFKSYSEKLWGISCKQLDSDFAAQRIKKLSLFEAIKSALIKIKKNKHKSLVDAFVYPNLGTGMIYERMMKKIKENGGNIYLNEKIQAVNPVTDNRSQNVEIILQNNSTKKYDKIISTMPITNLVISMKKIVSSEVIDCVKNLKFRNTILVYLEIDKKKIFPDQWIYIHAQNLKTGRITNFRNWTSTINKNKDETILCLEYWANDNSELWSENDKNLIDLASNEIESTGLVEKKFIKQGKVIKIPKCYPVYSFGYKDKLKPVQKFLDKLENIIAIGRYGSFKYNNQDHSILMGLLAARNIMYNKNHDLWSLNTDYEYQEDGELDHKKNN